MANQLITIKNYDDVIRDMDFTALPPELQKGMEFLNIVSEGDWQAYRNNKYIKQAVDTYFKELNNKLKNIKAMKTKKSNKDIPIEIQFIQRYLNLHNKTKPAIDIWNFIMDIHEAGNTGKITKNSAFSGYIKQIHNQLVKAYQKMEKDGTDRIKISLDKASIKKYKKVTENKGLGFISQLATGVATILTANEVKKRIEKPSRTKKNTVINSTQLANLKFEHLGLTGKFRTVLGNVTIPFSMMIYGAPGSGKSTFNILFAKYLADELNKKVLYIASEEGKQSATIKEKFERLNAMHPNIDLAESMAVNLNKYDIIFVDCVDDLQLSPDEIKNILDKHTKNKKSFIFVFRATKDGSFRGSLTYEHLMDISIQMQEGKTVNKKNRFGGSGVMRIW